MSADAAAGGAVLSDDGRYRYHLWRNLDRSGTQRALVFVMLNPSTADAEKDDQTIRRCLGYARRNGCNRLEVVNLFAWRATHPSELRDAAEAGCDPVGHDNLLHVDEALRRGRVVVAWGSGAAACPSTPVAELLANWSQPMWCLGRTKDGHPRHPSRGSYLPLERWTA